MQDHQAKNESFDIIVIGGGHAGCEAAITTAKLGFSTALFTINLDRIAWQPCNPAVGGPAKSQLVHEVDALGGIIGKLADETAIQKRILNVSRGVESRTNKRPMLSDLRESGSIEQDADLVLMIYRDEYYNPETEDRGITEIIVTKHRNGPVGTVKLLFEPQFTRFRNLAN